MKITSKLKKRIKGMIKIEIRWRRLFAAEFETNAKAFEKYGEKRLTRQNRKEAARLLREADELAENLKKES